MADIECDVLIVGSGIGGLTAAIAARCAGLRTLLVERHALIGGATALSGGLLWLPNNPLMLRSRVPDSRDAAISYLSNFVAKDAPGSTYARRAAFVDGVVPLVALYESQGIPLTYCEGYPDHHDLLPGGHATGRAIQTDLFNSNDLGPWRTRLRGRAGTRQASTAHATELPWSGGSWNTFQGMLRRLKARLRDHSLLWGGAALQGRLLLSALNLGCDVRTNASLCELCSSHGRISGAVVDFDGWKRRIHTSCAVIMAGGGPARDVATLGFSAAEAQQDGTRQAIADDMKDAMTAMDDVGAARSWSLDSWWALGFASPGGSNASSAGSLIAEPLHKPHTILVDSAGRRFVNEAASFVEVARACLERDRKTPAIPAWAIMDARHRRAYPFGTARPGRLPRGWLRDGIMFRDTSLEGLARQCSIDPGGLEACVTRWNTMAMQGRDDDFGKGRSAYNRYFGDASNTPNPCMGTIARAPFYAAPLHPVNLGSCSGVLTDEYARVLSTGGLAIEGLYATGNCTAPLTGAHYAGPGQSLGISAVFGMIAVRHMVG